MRIWGKILGTLFGLIIFKSILGALIGFYIGYRFDKARGIDFEGFSQNGETLDAQQSQAAFVYITFSVMGHVAKAKGRVSEHEIAYAQSFMDKWNLTNELREQAKEAFREGKTAGFPLEHRLELFRKSCNQRQDLMLLFMEIQIQVAFANGELDDKERLVLHKIAKTLGFSNKDLERLLKMIAASAAFHRSGNSFNDQQSSVSDKTRLKQAYQVLGLTEQASLAEVKKAHRKLMSQHHPDKLVAKGLPEEMMQIAKQKAQDIQAAYELISKSEKS